MASFAELEKLKLDSSRLPDQIVWRKEVEYSVPIASSIGDYDEYSYEHGLPFIPMIIGTFSDDDFATSYEFGTGPYEYLPTYAQAGFSMRAHAWSTTTHVYVRVQAHNSARTVKVRLIGLSPTGVGISEGDSVETPPIQDGLLFDTDQNYLKHYTLTAINMTSDGTGNYVYQDYLTEVDHPLTSLCFIYEDGKLSYGNTMNSISGGAGVSFVTISRANFLRLGVSSFSTKTVMIIIKTYLDA